MLASCAFSLMEKGLWPGSNLYGVQSCFMAWPTSFQYARAKTSLRLMKAHEGTADAHESNDEQTEHTALDHTPTLRALMSSGAE